MKRTEFLNLLKFNGTILRKTGHPKLFQVLEVKTFSAIGQHLRVEVRDISQIFLRKLRKAQNEIKLLSS